MSYEQEHEAIKKATDEIWAGAENLKTALKTLPLFSTTVGEYLSARSAVKHANSVLRQLEIDMGVNS